MLAVLPETITRAAYQDMIRALGFVDLNHLRSLEFHVDGIHAEVLALDVNGNRVLDDERTNVLTNSIYIPIVD